MAKASEVKDLKDEVKELKHEVKDLKKDAREREDAVEADVNPDLAFQAAWDKDESLRALLTRKGRIRGNLRPSQRAKAQEIIQQYGL